MSQSKKKSGVRHKLAMRNPMETLVREMVGEDPLANQGRHIQIPQADVYETAHEITMVVDLPGINIENIDLYIQHNKIIVEAVKKEVKAPKNARYHCIERLFGKFQRVIDIPTTVHTGKVEAKLNNGVLIVYLPKIEDRRGMKRRIEIK